MSGKRIFSMSAKEIEHLRVLQRIELKALKIVDAAKILNLRYRQACRIWQRSQEWGVHGLSHKSRGMPGKNCIDESLRKEALRLYKELILHYKVGNLNCHWWGKIFVASENFQLTSLTSQFRASSSSS
jgi:hypothetical protein